MRCLFYRVLLLLFPARIRREFGDEMVRLFAEQLRGAKCQGDSGLRVYAEAVGDAVIQGTAERIVSIRDGARQLIRGVRRWKVVDAGDPAGPDVRAAAAWPAARCDHPGDRHAGTRFRQRSAKPLASLEASR